MLETPFSAASPGTKLLLSQSGKLFCKGQKPSKYLSPFCFCQRLGCLGLMLQLPLWVKREDAKQWLWLEAKGRDSSSQKQ